MRSRLRPDHRLMVIGPNNPRIQYASSSTNLTTPSWTSIANSTQDASYTCDDGPEMVTSRIMDSMSFNFTGTSFLVYGTTDNQGGLIQFTLDNRNWTTFDRKRDNLTCDDVLFYVQQLDDVQAPKTLVVTLIAPDPGTGVGRLSIQGIQYTEYGHSSTAKLAAIIGIVIGVFTLIGTIAFIVHVRRKHRRTRDWQEGTIFEETASGSEEEHDMQPMLDQRRPAYDEHSDAKRGPEEPMLAPPGYGYGAFDSKDEKN